MKKKTYLIQKKRMREAIRRHRGNKVFKEEVSYSIRWLIGVYKDGALGELYSEWLEIN